MCWLDKVPYHVTSKELLDIQQLMAVMAFQQPEVQDTKQQSKTIPLA